MMIHNIRRLVVVAITLLALGCGGGSEESSPGPVQPNNRAPIVSQTIDSVYVEVGEEVDVDVTNGGDAFSDPDGDTLNYSVTLSDANSGLSVNNLMLNGRLTNGDKVTVTVTASDGNGGSASFSFDVILVDDYVSGKISYDDVPATINGLSYDSTQVKPVRGVYVELIDEADQVLQRVKTDEAGLYRFGVIDLSLPVAIRVKAELIDDKGAWYVRVVDNTRDNRLYAAETEFGSIKLLGSQRDLHLGSGWTGSEYGEPRSAAPFAILDTIYSVSERVNEAWGAVSFEPLNVYWSERNVPTEGDVAEGEVTTDSYFRGAIYLLGAEDVDTTEYDDAIIAHEWVHYFQDTVARDDSIGGPHSGGQLLDFRVAFSEGYATALGVYLLDADEYIDTYGNDQRSAFRLRPDNEPTVNQGWFNEDSVMRIVFDALDGGASDDDRLQVPLSDALSVHREFVNQTEFVSIFSWHEMLSAGLTNNDLTELDSIMSENRVFGRERYGRTESNDGGKINSLPIYDRLVLGQTVIRCMDDESGTYNKLDNARFFRFDGVANQNYRLTVERATGIGYPDIGVAGDPDYFIYAQDVLVDVGGSADSDREVTTFSAKSTLEHRVVLREYLISEDTTPRDDEYCYEVTLSLE